MLVQFLPGSFLLSLEYGLFFNSLDVCAASGVGFRLVTGFDGLQIAERTLYCTLAY